MKNNKRPHELADPVIWKTKLDIACSSCFSLVVIFHSVVDDMSTSTIYSVHAYMHAWIMDGG